MDSIAEYVTASPVLATMGREVNYLSKRDEAAFAALVDGWQDASGHAQARDEAEYAIWRTLWPNANAMLPWVYPSTPRDLYPAHDVLTRVTARLKAEYRAEAERRKAEEEIRAAERARYQAALLAEAETTGRACWVRFGTVPESGHSYNHRDNTSEPGVSVYAAWILPGDRLVVDLRDVDKVSAMFLVGTDIAYEVTGDLLAVRGSDDEPLLANAEGKRIDPETIERLTMQTPK